jgi:predicted DNA-binding protein (MmcQ/YjbR family)
MAMSGGGGAPDDRRDRLERLCLALPEATVRGGQHATFQVRGRTFAYYLDDHHGDGRTALCCKAPPGESAELIAADPARFFRPSYLGGKGWVSLRLDLGEVDWDEVAELVLDSYRLIAPKRLAAQAEQAGPTA